MVIYTCHRGIRLVILKTVCGIFVSCQNNDIWHRYSGFMGTSLRDPATPV